MKKKCIKDFIACGFFKIKKNHVYDINVEEKAIVTSSSGIMMCYALTDDQMNNFVEDK